MIEPSFREFSPILAWILQNIISDIRQFHDDMRACERLDDRVCSGWFAVERALQGCALTSLLLNIFFATIINLTYVRFKADNGIMDALVHLRKKTVAGRSNQRSATSLWGMTYADNAGVVSRSPEQLWKMMGVIVVVCVAFGLTVSGVFLR